MRREVRFLGHIVSKEGVRADPEKREAVKDIPRPNNVTDVRSFRGLTSYYRIVKHYSDIALYYLTKEDKMWAWSLECEKAFLELKNRRTGSPILAYPQADGGESILDTDASSFAIGSVLSQVQNGKERVIAYGSSTLDKPERNYCVTRRNMLAVVCFTKYFKHYLLGRMFTLRTDHGSLTWLQKFREPDGQIHRWLEQLGQFHMKILHRPGNKHATRTRCHG